MGKITSLPVALAISGILASGTLSAQKPLQYHGGPFLESFTIYPLYYGSWTKTDINNHHAYLTALAAYMSGAGAPAGQQPMTQQYGVLSASVAPAATASPKAAPVVLHKADVRNIIHNNQAAGLLPAYGPNTLIAIYPAHGFSVDQCSGCGGYHSSESTSSFYLVVPADQEQAVVAHEIFEASADPADDNFQGWDELVDQCDSAPNIAMSFGVIPPVTDNTNAGACSTTGYTTLDEVQDYGVDYTTYRADYDALWPNGWRLYILQSYVVNGSVLYNAVWRPTGNTPEIQDYGVDFTTYKAEYDKIYPTGWRIYILDTYVLADGTVRYNAVWRQGNLGEHQDYAVSYSTYRGDYNTFWAESPSWRLYDLQSYVTPSSVPAGQVNYNAVWRPGNSSEIQDYGWSYASYLSDYNTLWPEGWRLYSLQSYVLLDGTVKYNAVWRPGNHGEIQDYGVTYSQYRSDYNTLWLEGWRLYILQTYVTSGGQVFYNAVWRQGTIDRPL
jgi:hypothetical protein